METKPPTQVTLQPTRVPGPRHLFPCWQVCMRALGVGVKRSRGGSNAYQPGQLAIEDRRRGEFPTGVRAICTEIGPWAEVRRAGYFLRRSPCLVYIPLHDRGSAAVHAYVLQRRIYVCGLYVGGLYYVRCSIHTSRKYLLRVGKGPLPLDW